SFTNVFNRSGTSVGSGHSDFSGIYSKYSGYSCGVTGYMAGQFNYPCFDREFINFKDKIIQQQMKSITGIGLLMMMAVSLPLRAGDDFCGVKNTAFQANESITYR